MSHAYADGQRALAELDVDTTPFVGRAPELARLAGMLSRARLVTVVGTGGVGKTRLSLRAASQVASQFGDGVCVTKLSALSDPKLLPHTVAGRLGLAAQDTRSAAETVLDYLRDREMLLVLDTCEHLIDACAELAEALLEETSRITVLATSRQPLDVNGERLCPLLPLRVPAADAVFSPGDATDLFARRATAAAGHFAVTMDNRRDVVKVCERLDGIPLAIELAAVRLRTLPLAELARLFTDRLAISDTHHDHTDRRPATHHQRPAADGPRPAAGYRLSAMEDAGQEEARHRTLRATIGWSYDMCTPAEQALWERLSVFAGSFGVDAAREVCAGRNLPAGVVTETLVSLVDKSVLVRDKSVAGGRSRYRFLDTIREFGAERLAATGAETSVQGRLIARYRARARYFGDHLLDDDQLERYRELTREHANIRAALEYTLETGDHRRAREGAELAADLYGYWSISGRLREGGYWLGKVLERFPSRTRERARALVAWSYLTAFSGEIDKSVADATEGIAIAAELGDELIQGRGYQYLNLALTFGERSLAEAAGAGAEAERRFEALGDRIGLVCLDAQMAHLYQIHGKFQAAAERYNRGLHRFGATREPWANGYLHAIAGMSLFQQPGREAECAAAAGRALLAKHELDDILGMGYALEVFAWLASRAGRYERCAWLLGAADCMWERTGRRLSGTDVLTQFHERAAVDARARIGDQRFETVYGAGKYRPREMVVRAAVSDADSLPAVLPFPR